MRKSRLTLGRARLGTLAVGVLTAVFVVPGVALASSSTCSGEQCFAVAVSSASAPVGASTTFIFTISNESSRYPLNSVTITAPAGMEMTGVTLPESESSASVTPVPSTTSPTSSVIIGTPGAEGSNTATGALSLAHGASTEVAVTATAPCTATGSYSWAITGTNDGDGDSDDFQLAAASQANLDGAFAGSCYLAFATNGQPTDTVVNDPITSEVNSQGGPVQVEVMSAASTPVVNWTAPVALDVASTTASNPSLSGTATAIADPSTGIASFAGLSLNELGAYTLGASSSGITSATSADFDITDTIVSCTTASCAASASSTTTTGSISTSSATPGDYLEVGVEGTTYTCGSSYPLTTDTVSFDLFDSEGVAQSGAQFSATLEVSKAAVQASGHPGASSWQICYASTVPFTAQAGTSGDFYVGTTEYFTGLLPDCTSTDVAPCVESRNKNAANEIVTFLASGDPLYKG
jgi:hypothetical protein